MNIKNSLYRLRFLIILLVIAPLFLGFLGDDKKGTKPYSSQTIYKVGAATDEGGKKGDAYRLYINNINLPMNRKGVIAAVNIPDPVSTVSGAGGKFGGHIFLFSSGFFLSGYSNGTLFANAVASASLVEDYIPGLSGTTGDSRAQLYVVKATDPAFGTSWQDWKDAVDLGADFYDGDGDGLYTPADKNGNAQWDLDEDKPDILGDETVWTVYWDGVPAPQRRYNNVPPLGIEVRQSVFAFASGGAIGNLIFVRYRFKYVGLNDPNEPAQLDSVLFGVWADVDLGTATDDLVGSDVERNSGYTYNNGPDGEYGSNPPCYMIDFFSGPLDYIAGETYVDNNGNNTFDDGIDTPLDTAYSYRGQTIGIKTFPGARNLPIASFIEYINGDPSLNDPDNREAARNYMLGKTRQGDDIDPCSFPYGAVVGGVNCATVDPRFWYSGDPVTNVGWINTTQADSRQMTNTGPFTLFKNEEKEIVVAYVVGQGTDPKNSITVARKIDDGAQTIFNLNFLAPSPPPAPEVTANASEDFIELTWPTEKQFTYSNKTSSWDVQYGGYNVYAFQTFSTSETVNNQPNVKLIQRYQVADSVNNLYYKDGNNGGTFLLYAAAPGENVLDSNIYKDPTTGRIRYRITKDPFTDGPLVKGKPYYFAVTSYGVNHDALVNKSGGDPGRYGDYYLTDQTFVQAVENNKNIQTVLMGEDLYLPPVELINANKISGASNGIVTYDIVSQPDLKDNEYQVTFFKNEATVAYNMFWKLTNTTTGAVLVDSADYYLYNQPDNVTVPLTEGFITKIENQTATLGTPTYSPSSSVWFDDLTGNNALADANGVFYVGKDIPDGTGVFGFRNRQSDYITADKLRKVELRFGTTGKAYRYLNNYLGTSNLQRVNAYSYAGAVTAADTVGKGTVGNWNTVDDRANGFVDVPFTAWVVDEKFPGDTRQLTVGFVERRNVATYPNGTPDGIWDPTDSLNLSGEIIMIFDAPYDPNGAQVEYTGGVFNTPGGPVTVWSDLLRSTGGLQPIPADAIGITEEQKSIFLSPMFNAMYVVGLQRRDASSFYSNGDKLTLPLDIYPYTSDDVYKFNVVKDILSEDQARGLFEKVNVFPNPLYGYNPYTAYNNLAADDPFVTFTNLPNEEITVKIYSLSGQLLRTLVKDPNSTSPFLNWNLQNESGLRVASGLYLAIVQSPKYGDKVLKFSIIMPQKQLPRF
ncbi:MAG: T9SS type A sorting domain-containing protein [Ignavibacteriales bacterium]|nr:T9SS type A sorting domain-containing protein [Ignavibacteriales bacterium]